MAGAAEGPGGAGVTVLRLWAATSQTSHLTVCPIHHLYELSHPEDVEAGRGEWEMKKLEENRRPQQSKNYQDKKQKEERQKKKQTTEGREQ